MSDAFKMGAGGCCCGCWYASNTFDGLRNTGWKYPASSKSAAIGAVTGTAWLATASAQGDTDNTFSTVIVSGGAPSQFLILYNYGFTIPTGATISGAEVRILRKASAGGDVADESVYLHWDGGGVASTDHASADKWPIVRDAALYGSALDVWGIASGDPNLATFGVAVRVDGYTVGTERVASIDSVGIRIWYTGCGQFYDAWEACSGTWTMEDLVTSDPPSSPVYNCAMVAHTAGVLVWKRSPDGDTPRVGTMNVDILPNPGQSSLEVDARYRIYAFYDADCTAGSWVAADLIVTDGGGGVRLGRVSLYNSSGEITNSGTSNVTVTTGTQLSLCVGKTSLVAWCSASTDRVRACHNEGYNNKLCFAIGNASSTVKATFDNAYQIDHYDHDPDNCGACECSCESQCMPLALCLTIHDYDGCANINHTAINMTLSASCAWQSAAWTCGPYANMYFRLVPIGSGSMLRREWTLTLHASDGTAKATNTATINSTCVPLYLEFGPMFAGVDTPYSKCCTGIVCAGSEGGTCIDWDPSPVEYWWRPGNFTVTVVEGPCA